MKKVEEILEEKIKNSDFLYTSGSRLYGMDTEHSDHDIRGYVLPPYEYLIGVKKFDCRELEGDCKIYSLKRFLELVIKGDPQNSEAMFVPKEYIHKTSEISEIVFSLKKDLISNAIYNRIMGYSISEWRKSMAIKIVSKKWRKEKKDIINDIRNLYNPNKEVMDDIIKKLDKFDEKEVISSLYGLGISRKKDVEEFGYCRKSAAHSIRLLNQLKELILTGNITFPRPNANFLLDIRNGKFSKEELQEIYDEIDNDIKEEKNKSILPNKPNIKKVWKIYSEIVSNFLSKDKRFKELLNMEQEIF